MEVQLDIPEGRQIVQGYGDHRFRISGTVHEGSVIVLPDRTLAWPVEGMADVTYDSLAQVVAVAGLEILVIGCGPRIAFIDPGLRQAVRDHGIVIEPMDTGAACRTFNVLMSEERRAAAALIAVA